MEKTSIFLKLIVTCQLLLVLSFLFLVVLPSPAHAQTPYVCPTDTSGAQVLDKANGDAIKQSQFDSSVFNFNQTSALVDSLGILLTGCSTIHPSTNVATAGTGALAVSSRMVTAMYTNPPASGVSYLAQKIQQLNPIQPAYAQAGTTGFDALQPIVKIWTAFRNISYVGFVIVFIVIGFMVMFRAKVSPQAVATVQDSIPRIVIALIFVTFSYAIVGFMIDLMFVFLNIMINGFAATGLISQAQASNIAFQKSIFGVFKDAWGSLIGVTASAVKEALGNVGVGGAGLLTDLLKWGTGGVAGVIVAIAGLFIMFRIFFMLLMAYISIIIMTIFAPFLLLFQALPGNNGAKAWLKNVVANIAVFPTVAIMIIIAGILSGIQAFGGTGTSQITPGQVGQFPLLSGQLQTDSIGKIVGLGVLFMIPSAAGLIKKRFGVEGAPFGGAGVAALGAAGGFAAQRVQSSAPARALTDVLEERGRRNTANIVGRLPSWMGGPAQGADAEHGTDAITRRRVRQ